LTGGEVGKGPVLGVKASKGHEEVSGTWLILWS
jgi:hypothetical protein